jgi:hypothetical protein
VPWGTSLSTKCLAAGSSCCLLRQIPIWWSFTENAVGLVLDVSITAFSKILMLVMGLTLPIIDA